MKNSLIVNLFSDYKIDRSIISAYILAQLKVAGVNVELVSSWTKGHMDGDPVFNNPLYLFGKQSYILRNFFGKVDVIINESPILSGVMFIDKPLLKYALVEEHMSYGENNLEIYLYDDDNGETYKNTINDICENIGYQKPNFVNIPATMDGCGQIVQLVLNIVKYMTNPDENLVD